MDTLPKEIKYFYQPIEIDVKTDHYDEKIYFYIKYYSMIIRINTTPYIFEDFSDFSYIHKYYKWPENRFDKRYENPLNKFITQLSKNKECYYDESYYYDCEKRDAFQIEIEGDIIKISNGMITIELPMNTKPILLNAMKKYEDILNG